MTAASHPQIPLIDEFLQAMSADRGLARNSLDAYRLDLEAAASRLAAAGSAIDSCNAEDLRRVLAGWHEDGLAPRSVARRLSAGQCRAVHLYRHHFPVPCQFEIAYMKS